MARCFQRAELLLRASHRRPRETCRGWLPARRGGRGCRSRTSLIERAAWVGPLGDVGRFAALLDHRVVLVLLDDVLDLGELVTGHDREAQCVLAYRLVLGAAEPQELVASQTAAL